MTDLMIQVEGAEMKITNPDKLLWPEWGITKLTYIKYLVQIAPYMLVYMKDRFLTTIRYPDGIYGKSFYQKNVPVHAPPWVKMKDWQKVKYILCNDAKTLAWLGSQACLELHVSFNRWQKEEYPTELVFDLDPSVPDRFDQVLEVAGYFKDVFDDLGLKGVCKTSGATGIQIYVPIMIKYPYEKTRELGHFIAKYFAEKHPEIITLERLVKNRGRKLYIDYLQQWRGKTLTAPYSARAREIPTVSAPVTWDEVKRGFVPEQFTILNIIERIEKIGNLFSLVTEQENRQSLDPIFQFLEKRTLLTSITKV